MAVVDRELLYAESLSGPAVDEAGDVLEDDVVLEVHVLADLLDVVVEEFDEHDGFLSLVGAVDGVDERVADARNEAWACLRYCMRAGREMRSMSKL